MVPNQKTTIKFETWLHTGGPLLALW